MLALDVANISTEVLQRAVVAGSNSKFENATLDCIF